VDAAGTLKTVNVKTVFALPLTVTVSPVRMICLRCLLPAAALSGFPLGLGRQLHSALHLDPGRALEAPGLAGTAAKLWDSRRQLPGTGDAGTSLAYFPGFG